MKKFLYSTGFFLSLLLTGCNSCGNESGSKVMTAGGAWDARLREMRSDIVKIEKTHTEGLKYEFDSIDHENLNSEYPYWKDVHVYLNEKGIQKAILYSDPAKGLITEEFFFDNGRLIYAQADAEGFKYEGDSAFHGERFFYYQKQLVYAQNTDGDFLNLQDDQVALKSVDLTDEASQIKEIMAKKQFEF